MLKTKYGTWPMTRLMPLQKDGVNSHSVIVTSIVVVYNVNACIYVVVMPWALLMMVNMSGNSIQ